MATIAEIENNLLISSSAGNSTLFRDTLISITTAQKPLVTVYSEVLGNLLELTPSTSSTMTRYMMQYVGTYVNYNDIGNAMTHFAQTGNFAALDAVTDYLSATQKTDLGTTPYAGTTLSNIVWFDQPGTLDDTAITNAVRNLMAKLGAQTHYNDIGFAMQHFASTGNFAALDAVTDYLTTAQKTDLGTTPYAGTTLANIVWFDQPGTLDDTAITNAVRNLMSKLGAQTHYNDIGFAMQHFAQTGNFAALDAVTDYLTATQKTDIGTTPYAGTTLANIVWVDQPGTLDDTAITNAVRNLMSKLGAQTNYNDIGFAMQHFASTGNFAALDAVTDYLTTVQRTDLGMTPYVGTTLSNIVWFDQPGTLDDGAIADATRNLMAKLGAQTHYNDIGFAMQHFASTGNFAALDAVTDYLTTAQRTDLGTTPYIVQTIANIGWVDQPGTIDDATIAGAVRDLTSKLGAQYSDYDVQTLVQDAIFNGNINMVDALIGELPAAKLTSVLNLIAPDLAAAGITLGTQSATTYNGTSGADKHLALGGNDTLYGNDGDDQLYGDVGTDRLYGGNHNDVLHGGSGNDTLYGDAGGDILMGGLGADTLYGGTGGDTFVFALADRGTGTDVIKDLNLAEGDAIDISSLLSQYSPVDDAISEFVRLTTSGSNTLVQVDIDGADASVYGFTTIANIEGVTGLNLTTLINSGDVIV